MDNNILSEFQKTLGIQTREITDDDAVLVLPVKDRLLNTFGIAHGGNHIALGNASMRTLVGADATQVSTTVEYFDKVSSDGEMRAEAKILRNGRSFVFAEACLYEDERMVARVSAQYSRLFEVEQLNCQHEPWFGYLAPTVHLTRSYKRKMPDQERIVRNLFNQRDLFRHLTQSSEGLCLSLETTKYHAGFDGYVDRAVYGVLADNALGFSCFSQGHVVVTTRLAVNLVEPVKVGSTLYCQACIDGCSGNIYFSSGSLWAEDKIVGTCEGVFSAIMPLEEFKKTLLSQEPTKE